MPKTLLIAMAVLTFAFVPSRSTGAQTVDLVLGTIVEPAGIKNEETPCSRAGSFRLARTGSSFSASNGRPIQAATRALESH